MKGLKRHLYRDLLRWKGAKRRKPLILYGVRQCGKSYLVREQFGPTEYAHVHILDFKEKGDILKSIFEHDYDIERILRELAVFLGQDIDPKTDLIVFDEVQECLKVIESLKYFCEKAPECHIIALGSMLRVKLSGKLGIAESDHRVGELFSFPVGKVNELNLFPMNFSEFLEASKDHTVIESYNRIDRSLVAHQKLMKMYLDYLFVGGMPEAVVVWFSAENDGSKININQRVKEVRDIHHSLLAGYKRDFVLKGNVVDGSHLVGMYDSIFTQIHHQMIVDDSIKRFKFKGIIPGKSKYEHLRGVLDWLALAGLIHKVFVISANPQNSPEALIRHNIFKVMPHDIGLFNAKLNHSYKDLTLGQLGMIKGPMGEIFVACELRSMSTNYESTPLMAWSDEKCRYELEFVVHDEQYGTYPIEVKGGEHVTSKSLEKYKELFHPAYSVKLSARAGGMRETNHYLLPIYFASLHKTVFGMGGKGDSSK